VKVVRRLIDLDFNCCVAALLAAAALSPRDVIANTPAPPPRVVAPGAPVVRKCRQRRGFAPQGWTDRSW
jgi:hypothetical protein